MSDTSAKQQIVDKIKNSTNILVTVSRDPSVDELSAALGLSLLLNKMKKHATAVFSGNIPPAITFLDPEKTFENSVDSLRDFIIALDKEKADHLRYKVEGDVVKIFITPYRTTITSDDLEFSQGDYNVEMVLALGVKSQDNLDKALEAHGRILSDTTVATIMTGAGKSELGSISWRDAGASSLSEMMVSLSEGLKVDKTLIDEQIATAFLAGIVAATERFSNNHTSARVMTMAAQLMGQGANQQLIASKFEEVEEYDDSDIEPEAPSNELIKITTQENKDVPVGSTSETELVKPQNLDGTTRMEEGESTKVERVESSREAEADAKASDPDSQPSGDGGDGTLNISHEKEGTLEEVAEQTLSESQAEAAQAAEAKLFTQAEIGEAPDVTEPASLDELPQVVAPALPDLSPSDIKSDFEAAGTEVATAADEKPRLQGAVSVDTWKNTDEPAYGGTLNATTEIAAQEARRIEADTRNKTILNHNIGYIADDIPPKFSSPLNAMARPPEDTPIINILDDTTPGAQVQTPKLPPLMDASQPAIIPAGLPPLPDFSTLPPLPPAMAGAPGIGQSADRLGDILPPAEQTAAISDDPAQFKIPGQS